MKFLKKYLVLIIIFTLLILFLNQYKVAILENLGEKLFLAYHQNSIAIKTLELAKKYENQNFYTYYLLGRIYFVQNELAKSIENYNQAIELNPLFKENYYGRGLTYGFLNPIFYKDAEKDFQKYIELDKQEFEKTGKHAYGAWAGYNDLAWIYFLAGDYPASEKTAREGLQISESNPWLKNMLGSALIAQKKCSEAKDYLETAQIELGKINSQKFGEAYSGDNPDFWEIGKNQMAGAISENLTLCIEQVK